MAQTQQEQREALALAEKPQHSRREGGAGKAAWVRASARLTAPATRPLMHGDLHGVGGGEFARQVVIDAPRQAGSRDQHRAPVERRSTLPRQQNRSGQYGEGAEQQSPVDIFAEERATQRPLWPSLPD